MSDINAGDGNAYTLFVRTDGFMFRHAVTLFTIHKFDIKLDPSWLIVAALMTWTLSQTYFPNAVPDQSSLAYLVMALVAMVGLFTSLLLHELAHSVVARRLGMQIKGITLFLFGGVAELNSEPNSASDEIRIAVAGPLMSFFLAGAFWVCEHVAVVSGLHLTAISVLSYLALVNLLLAVFNLIPAFPLDGGRVLRAYLWQRSGDVLHATRMASRTGAVAAYVLMGLGVIMVFKGAVVAGLWQLMIGAFVLVAARAGYVTQLVRSTTAGKTVADLMRTDPVTVSPDCTLAAFVNQIMLRHGITFAPVTDGPVLLGHMDQSVLASIDRGNWANTQVGDVFVGLDEQTMVAPDLPVHDLFEAIAATGRRKFLVTADHCLIGVITLSDLTRYLGASQIAPDASNRATPRGWL